MATSSNPEIRRPKFKALEVDTSSHPIHTHIHTTTVHKPALASSAKLYLSPKPKPSRNQDKMNRTDEELDRDWKPNGRRPQSCVKFPFSSPRTAHELESPTATNATMSWPEQCFEIGS